MMLRGNAREIERPQIGFWAVKLVSGGVEVAASIQLEQTTVEPGEPENLMERSPILTARMDDVKSRTGLPATIVVPLEDVWTRRGRAISVGYYRWLLADRAWARRYAPNDPAARPYEPVDLRRVAPVGPPARRA